MEAARWVLGRSLDTVVDLGAGTGGLTRSLVQLAERVLALEPDRRMASVLRRRTPGASVAAAVGEQLPLPAGSVDAVTASSSWHWMDPEKAGAEVARVLHPGGAFGLLWSGPDRRVPWVAALLGAPGRDRGDRVAHAQRRTMVLAPELPFAERETQVFAFHKTFQPDELVGLAGTYSVAIVSSEQRQRRRDAVSAMVREHFGNRPVEVPMVCRCWRTTRLP